LGTLIFIGILITARALLAWEIGAARLIADRNRNTEAL
jgi:hypothetical protein